MGELVYNLSKGLSEDMDLEVIGTYYRNLKGREFIIPDRLWIRYPIKKGSHLAFSGAKTSDGINLYENDIVRKENVALGCTEFTGVIKYSEGCWWIDDGRDAVKLWDEVCSITKLGTVKDNPELLLKMSLKIQKADSKIHMLDYEGEEYSSLKLEAKDKFGAELGKETSRFQAKASFDNCLKISALNMVKERTENQIKDFMGSPSNRGDSRTGTLSMEGSNLGKTERFSKLPLDAKSLYVDALRIVKEASKEANKRLEGMKEHNLNLSEDNLSRLMRNLKSLIAENLSDRLITLVPNSTFIYGTREEYFGYVWQLSIPSNAITNALSVGLIEVSLKLYKNNIAVFSLKYDVINSREI